MLGWGVEFGGVIDEGLIGERFRALAPRLDERDDPKKVQVSDEDLAAVNLTPDPFHPEWNYTISPDPNPAR